MQNPTETSSFSTLYDILGVLPTATEEQIRLAYRVEIKKNPSPSQKFLIKQTFLTLSDSQKRPTYDQRLTATLNFFNPASPERQYFASKNKAAALIPLLAPPQSQFINLQLILNEYQHYHATERRTVLLSLLRYSLSPTTDSFTSEKYLKLFKHIGKLDYEGCLRALFYRMFDYIKNTFSNREIFRPGVLFLMQLRQEFHEIDPKSLSLERIKAYLTCCESIPPTRNLGLFTATQTEDVIYCKYICTLFKQIKSAHDLAEKEAASSRVQAEPAYKAPMRPLVRVY